MIADAHDHSPAAAPRADPARELSRAHVMTSWSAQQAIDPLPLFNDHPYDLQVTSPGATRALSEPRHFRRARRRIVSLRTTGGEDLRGLLGVRAQVEQRVAEQLGPDSGAVQFR